MCISWTFHDHHQGSPHCNMYIFYLCIWTAVITIGSQRQPKSGMLSALKWYKRKAGKICSSNCRTAASIHAGARYEVKGIHETLASLAVKQSSRWDEFTEQQQRNMKPPVCLWVDAKVLYSHSHSGSKYLSAAAGSWSSSMVWTDISIFPLTSGLQHLPAAASSQICSHDWNGRQSSVRNGDVCKSIAGGRAGRGLACGVKDGSQCGWQGRKESITWWLCCPPDACCAACAYSDLILRQHSINFCGDQLEVWSTWSADVTCHHSAVRAFSPRMSSRHSSCCTYWHTVRPHHAKGNISSCRSGCLIMDKRISHNLRSFFSRYEIMSYFETKLHSCQGQLRLMRFVDLIRWIGNSGWGCSVPRWENTLSSFRCKNSH